MDWLTFLTNSEEIIRTGGVALVTFIIFAENGLFFAFFLPGDYLLFLAGVFCSAKLLSVPIGVLMLVFFIAAILGSLLGYATGRFFGNWFFNTKDSIFFKKKSLDTTKKYFDKYGSRTLIIARFLPVVRTFAPILAGFGKMSFLDFLLFNILGGSLWVFGLTGLGFWLGAKFPSLINYSHYIILFFLSLTTYTLISGYFKTRKELKNDQNSETI